jgi:hypothetical protein
MANNLRDKDKDLRYKGRTTSNYTMGSTKRFELGSSHGNKEKNHWQV